METKTNKQAIQTSSHKLKSTLIKKKKQTAKLFLLFIGIYILLARKPLTGVQETQEGTCGIFILHLYNSQCTPQ